MSTPRSVDCLILGSGIAGLSSAIALGEAGFSTLVVTAAPTVTETNTSYAQGGIIFESRGANPELLVKDILEAGSYQNYEPAVRLLVEKGGDLVQKLLIDKAGARFDKADEDHFHLTREGAHSENRILHWGDESGRSIAEALWTYAHSLPSLEFVTSTTAVNLLMTSYHPKEASFRQERAQCFGAYVYDQKTQNVYSVYAQHTILATGGVGQVFLHNTNSKFSRGDGLALAYRAGCRMKDLEYVQFHPTTFYHPKAKRFLISEAVRGEGGRLINALGERFLDKYLPDLEIPELGPRDRVAQAIQREMLNSQAPCVYLDISHKPAQWVQDRFPFIYRSCLNNGVDITKEPIPVVPGAHYYVGGVWSDLRGLTSIPHLWAVGEVACTGLHGANRLASTSLLEGLVWGTEAGNAIVDSLKASTRSILPEVDPWQLGTAPVDPSFLRQDWLMLKHTMWNYVGLIKTEARLSRAQGILNELVRGINIFYQKATLSDELIGLRHASLAGSLILKACIANPKSLGCYLREEHAL